MKASNKMFLRKSKDNIFSLIILGLLVTIASIVFTTLFSISWKYDESANKFIEDLNTPKYVGYGAFDSAPQGSEGRNVRDYTYYDTTIRVVSITDEFYSLYINEGQLPTNDNEAAVLYRNGYNIGDVITVDNKEYQITALVSSAEYIYMFKDQIELFKDQEKFIILYIQDDSTIYNQMLTDNKNYITNAFSIEETAKSVPMQFLEDDIDQIETFAKTFPTIFIILVLIIVSALITRATKRDYKIIGVIKSLGHKDYTVMLYYISQFILVMILGTLLGVILSYPLFNILVDLFSQMFYVPTLTYTIYFELVAILLLTEITLTIIVGYINVKSILNKMPANIIRGNEKKTSSKLLVERTFIWKKLSFNTRYTIRSILRSKGLYIASIISIAGACALILLSQGFINTINYTLIEIEESYDYEFRVYDDGVISNKRLFDYKSSYAYYDEIKIDSNMYRFEIVDTNNSFYNNYLEDGVVIPSFYNKTLNLQVGDSITINDYTYRVNYISNDEREAKILTSYNASNFNEYNTIYIYENTQEIVQHLEEENLTYGVKDDTIQFLKNLCRSLIYLMYVLVVMSFILLIATTSAIGLINISYREYEYMFMGVMGIKRISVALSMLKELLCQLILAIPIGLVLGYVLLNNVLTLFSNEFVILHTKVDTSTFIFTITSVTILSLIILLFNERYVSRLDIVQGLKIRDE